MGLLTYSRAITGTLNSKSYSLSDSATHVVDNGWVNDYSIAATTWTTIKTQTTSTSEWVLAIINFGSNPAVYRIKVGSDYWRFNLPAGKSVKITGNGAYGGSGNEVDLAVYSALGTDIQVGYFY